MVCHTVAAGETGMKRIDSRCSWSGRLLVPDGEAVCIVHLFPVAGWMGKITDRARWDKLNPAR
jgi:hypothetical protein